MTKYKHKQLETSKAKDTVSVEIVDAAIASDFFWAAMHTLNMACELIRQSFSWAEGCACHHALDGDAVDYKTRQRWAHCLLRGLRLPEVSCGLFDIFERLQN